MSLHCVVHYNYLKNSEIKSLTVSSHATLKENKLARQRLGGENEHFAQCQTVPDILDTRVHGSHRKCYQKFTKGVSIEKRRTRNKVQQLFLRNEQGGLEKDQNRFLRRYVYS